MSPTIRSEVTAGVRASWTVALGLLPLGLAFGLLVSQSGFAWWWTPVFSFVIYAGSMEFLAISLVTGGVAPLSAVYLQPTLHNPLSLSMTERRRIELACLSAPIELDPCYNDLLNANVIDDGARIRIVDWEYAGMGDPLRACPGRGGRRLSAGN